MPTVENNEVGLLDTSAPDRIWLQVDSTASSDRREEPFPTDLAAVTWSGDSVGGLEVSYVRADLAHGHVRPMATAPEDGTPVLLKVKAAADLPERVGALAERWFVGSNRGDASEWGFAAPVGYGGIATAWLAGWMPTPDRAVPERGALSESSNCDALRPAAHAFLDFFRDRCEVLFATFGAEAVSLFNAAQAERRAADAPVIDLKASGYDYLMEAAFKAPWLPPEYTANDILADLRSWIETEYVHKGVANADGA